MKRQVLVFLLVIIVTGCSGAGGGGVDQSLVGQEVLLSEAIQSEILPETVTHYGAGQVATLSNLQLSAGNPVAGTVDYTLHEEGELALVVHVSTPRRRLAIYFEPDHQVTIIEPSGQGGNALIRTSGFVLHENDGGGTFEFEFPSEVFNMYNIIGASGMVHVYCVQPSEEGIIYEDLVSNVVSIEGEF